MRHLVGQRQHVVGRLEVTHRPVQVDRLDRIAADEVHDLEGLAQLEQVPEAVAVAGSTHAVRGRRGWAGCRPSRRPGSRRRSSTCGPGSRRAAGTPTGRSRCARRPAPGRSGPARRRRRSRRPPGARGPPGRGSSCRSRRGSAATPRGSPPARRPRRPPSGRSAAAAGRTDAARAGGRRAHGGRAGGRRPARSCGGGGGGIPGTNVPTVPDRAGQGWRRRRTRLLVSQRLPPRCSTWA